MLAVTVLLTACEPPSNGANYRLISSKIITSPATGASSRVRQWQYDDGTITTTTTPLVRFGNQTNRGSKLPMH
jgi:hypothetical protein